MKLYVIINGIGHSIEREGDDASVSFEDVVRLAFEEPPTRAVTVKAHNVVTANDECCIALLAGQKVVGRNGSSFDVLEVAA